MNIDEWTSQDVHAAGGGETPPCAGFASSALPEAQSCMAAENSHTGVSTRNVPLRKTVKQQNPCNVPRWHVLRATYGREKIAYDFFVENGITAFYPTMTTVKMVDGKRMKVTESRIPNILFAYGTELRLKTFVCDDANLPFLRFYYKRNGVGTNMEKKPLTVPDREMESLRIVCAAEGEDIIICSKEVDKFEKGEMVIVKEGQFAGFTGRVARFKGQQRVGIVINDFGTVCTAYVPNAFCEKMEE